MSRWSVRRGSAGIRRRFCEAMAGQAPRPALWDDGARGGASRPGEPAAVERRPPVLFQWAPGGRRYTAATVLLLSLLPFTVFAGWGGMSWERVEKMIQSDFPDVPTVSIRSMARAVENGKPFILLDVREEEEFAVSHMAGAVRATTVDEAVRVIEDQDPAPVIAYCSVGYRSAALVTALQAAGYTNAWNLEGSIFAWANAGLPVYRGTNVVEAVHPYDRRWGKLLKEALREYSVP